MEKREVEEKLTELADAVVKLAKESGYAISIAVYSRDIPTIFTHRKVDGKRYMASAIGRDNIREMLNREKEAEENDNV